MCLILVFWTALSTKLFFSNKKIINFHVTKTNEYFHMQFLELVSFSLM